MKAEDRERYQQELLRALDKLDQIKVEAANSAKEWKGEIAKWEQQIVMWRQLLSGRGGVQLPLPETTP